MTDTRLLVNRQEIYLSMEGRHRMDQIIRIMIECLVGKGIGISTIPAYIRNLANTLSVNPHSSFQELNRRMQLLGWNDFELDDHTLQLIIAIFEADGRQSFGQGSSSQPESPFNPDKIFETYDSIRRTRDGNYESRIQSDS